MQALQRAELHKGVAMADHARRAGCWVSNRASDQRKNKRRGSSAVQGREGKGRKRAPRWCGVRHAGTREGRAVPPNPPPPKTNQVYCCEYYGVTLQYHGTSRVLESSLPCQTSTVKESCAACMAESSPLRHGWDLCARCFCRGWEARGGREAHVTSKRHVARNPA